MLNYKTNEKKCQKSVTIHAEVCNEEITEKVLQFLTLNQRLH